MTLDLREILGALSSVALIVGVIIAVMQLRGLRAERHLEQVLRAYMPFLEENLTRVYWHVHNRDYATWADFQSRATLDDWTDMDQVTTFFEMMACSTSAASPASSCSTTCSRARWS